MNLGFTRNNNLKFFISGPRKEGAPRHNSRGFFILEMRKNILLSSLVVILICFGPRPLLSQAVPKQRVVSIAPSVTEILFRLGLDDEIVGVSTFCNYPPKAKAKEKAGTFSQPSIEKIVFLKPDIVFATGLEQASIVDDLRRLGMKVFVSDPASFKELFSSIREIAKLIHREQKAELLIRQMEERIERINDKVKLIPQAKRLSVFIEIGVDPLMTAGSGSFVGELISLAGGINIASDLPRSYSYFSSEQVLERNPDCIILGYMNKNPDALKIGSRLGWGNIAAVKNNRIYRDIDPNLFFRPGPRLVEGLEAIHKRLYPE